MTTGPEALDASGQQEVKSNKQQRTSIVGRRNSDETEEAPENQKQVAKAERRASRKLRPANRFACDIGTARAGRHTDEDEDEQEQQLCVDSRSILNNKQRLKRFWERRMEMEFRARQQQQQQQAAVRGPKVASQDENNNNQGDQADLVPPDGGEHDEPKSRVSAELLCERLMAYEQQLQRHAHAGKQGGVAAADNPNCQATKGQLQQQQQQPMSINPNLCHSTTGDEGASETSGGPTGEPAGKGEAPAEEEQVAAEEFSSSNSSFGPMSIAMPARRASDDRKSEGDSEEEEEEEENSTQSGSVLTVISANPNPQPNLNPNPNPNPGQAPEEDKATPTLITSIEDEETNEPTEPDDDRSSEGENIGVAFESLHFDEGVKSSRSELVDEERLLAASKLAKGLGKAESAKPADSSSSSTGNNGPARRFGAREVKSVCALISGAISDAAGQVETLMGAKNSNSTPAAAATNKTADGPVAQQPMTTNQRRGQLDDESSTFQRATFVGRQAGDGSDSPPGHQQQIINSTTRPQPPPGANLLAAAASKGQAQQDDDEPPSDYDDELLAATCQEQVATIGYLADEDEDDEQHDDGDDDDDYDQRRAREAPRADLSSMFEANVRREIQRFESCQASLGRDQNGQSAATATTAMGMEGAGKLLASQKSGLTEWRIAEEIRLFNERERELKQRSSSSSSGRGDFRSQAVAPPGGARAEQQLESIVRFGKTLKIPKPAANLQVDTRRANNEPPVSRSIRLTTQGNASPNQAPSTISMHKFISSGGKRYVYQTAQVSSGEPQLGGQFTKSMSNLSSMSSSGASSNSSSGQAAAAVATPPPGGRTVDYRAVDSLKCKEVPNVAPGLAKKTIETFTRLNSETSLNKLAELPNYGGSANSCASLASNPNNGQHYSLHGHHHLLQRVATNSNGGPMNHGRHASHQQGQHSSMVHQGGSSAGHPSAEWKIQEELREMKAREAELRSLRNQHQQQQVRLRQQQKEKNDRLAGSTSQSMTAVAVAADSSPNHNNGSGEASGPNPGARCQVGDGKQKPATLSRPNRFQLQINNNNNNGQQRPVAFPGNSILARNASERHGGDNHDGGCDSIRDCDEGVDRDLAEVHDDDDATAKQERIKTVTPSHLAYHVSPSLHGPHNNSRHDDKSSSGAGAGNEGELNNGSSDSLYPIKQTIDSFRKLNQQSMHANGELQSMGASDGNNNSSQVSMTLAHRMAGTAGPNQAKINKKSGQASSFHAAAGQGGQRKQFVNSSASPPSGGMARVTRRPI